MDNSRDVRRGGASRFSPAKRQIIKQSGMDGNGGDVVVSEKSKKQKQRRLSGFGRVSSSNENCEMGSVVGSDGEDEFRPTASLSKRFKLPRKFFDDCNTVDHASVPRKLRSAMKKRDHEYVSPPLPDNKKQPNHGINGAKLPRKDSLKKSKLKQQQRDSEGSPSRTVVVPITKDEEEVVETLYALAEMFPFPNNDRNNLDYELTNAKSSPMPEGESLRPAFEASEAPEKEEDSNSKSLRPSTTAEAASPSLLEGSAQETVQVKCSNEPSQPGLPNSTQLHTELDNTISQRNVQAMSLLSKSEPIDGKRSCSSVGCNVQSELSLGTGSKQPKHEEATAYVGKPEIEVGPAASVGCQHELQHTLKESKNIGSALWPGLSSSGSPGAGIHGPSLQSSPAKTTAWLGKAASAAQPGSLDNGVLTEKHSRAPIARKNSWKRCSAHVYISRLIKVLQIAEKRDRSPVPATQLTPNEGSNEGVILADNHLNAVRSGLNRSVSAHSTVGSAAEKNPIEVRNAILLHKRLVQDHQQASTASALYTTQKKQSFDFLSLSAGGGGVEATNSTNKVGNMLEPLTQFHIPYMPSFSQNHTVLPYSLPQNRYSSTPFTDNLPAAAAKQVQIQPPQYVNGALLDPPHLGTSAPPRQQQWIWTAQLAAQYKPMGVAASYIPNWENGRQNPSAIQFAQSILPPSHCSVEVLGPKYAPILQQQQQLIAVTSSLPTARAKRQHHHLPSCYEGNGVSSCPDTALPLQLLCNEHL